MTTNDIDMSWREHAACIGKSDLFFNDNMSTVVRKAKGVCATCVVRLKCLDHAMKHQEFGVWGGMTANERRVAKRRLLVDSHKI
jgi:WhiB family redox-sensing transcriptional regulator